MAETTMLERVIDLAVMQDLLSVGTLGFVLGVLLPWGARLIGYVVDSVRVILR